MVLCTCYILIIQSTNRFYLADIQYIVYFLADLLHYLIVPRYIVIAIQDKPRKILFRLTEIYF